LEVIGFPPGCVRPGRRKADKKRATLRSSRWFSAQKKEPALTNKEGDMSWKVAVLTWAFVLVLMGSFGHAATTVTVTYIEPNQTVGGDPITNLKEIAIYLKQDNGVEQKIVIPATKATGGGTVSKVIAVNDPSVCKTTTITVHATASNTIGNESARAGPASVVKSAVTPDCGKSKAPTNLTITVE